MDNIDENSDSDYEEEIVKMETSSLCLFCEENFSSPESTFEHCMAKHDFDISSFLMKYKIDAIFYIKLINYIRQMKPSLNELKQTCSISWDKDDYMKPHLNNDSLLTFDIEDYIENSKCHNTHEKQVAISRHEYNKLTEKISLLQQKLRDSLSDMEKMRQAAHTLVNSQDSMKFEKEEDLNYFSTYAHYGIHQEMLQDKMRTEAYKNAIFNNKNIFENKIVLDVGCGTSILSMFCASAGAKQVISVDQSDIIYQAIDIVRENKLDNIIHLQKGYLEDLTLPVERVDIIVSEWMGYFLLFEGMIDSIIFARNQYLNDGGFMFPNRCTISLIASSDEEMHNKYINYWDDVYGYKMTSMKQEVIKEATVELIENKNICSTSAVVKELDILKCCTRDCEFSCSFELEQTVDATITAIIGYFDCYFDERLINPVKLSTSPLSAPTHWKQTVFLLSSPIVGKKGDILKGHIHCRRGSKEHRSLIIKLKLCDNNQVFILS